MAANQLSLEAAASRIKAKRLSSVELTKVCLEQSEKLQASLTPFVRLDRDKALRAARRADRDIAGGKYRGPLHGIPVAVKDICDMKGLPTTASSKVLRQSVATADSAVVERLQQAGAVIIGKTHTHEYAYGVITPTTRNPWNAKHIPGGSSGGSGAAVAGLGCFGAIGTDTGGSIRIPAAVCGAVGLKPTFGRVSRVGIASLSWSLDHAGPLTRRVRDAAIMLNALAGFDGRDPGSIDVPVSDFLKGINRGVKGLRLGVPTNYFFDGIDGAVEAAVRAGMQQLKKLGAKLVPVALPLAETYVGVEFGLCLPEASAYHQPFLRKHAELYNDDVRAFLEAGELALANDYIKALRLRQLIKEAWAVMFRKIDALLAPTVPATAAAAGQEVFRWPNGAEEPVSSAYVRTSCPANITGLPALSLPCGFANGLPIGMQILGRPFDEATVLRIGQAYEAATEWHKEAPPI